MRILKEQATAVVIDIQERLHPNISNHEQLTENAVKLITGLKHLEVPIMVTQQYTKALGNTIQPIAEALGEYTPIEKVAFSCLDEAVFQTQLQESGKKFLIILGEESHICVLQTAIDAIEKGLVPVIVADCVSSRKDADKNTAIERLRKEGAIVTSYESLLFELCRYAGTAVFKEISKLVK